MKDWKDLRVGDTIVEKGPPFRVYVVVGSDGDFNTLLNLTTESRSLCLVDSYKDNLGGAPRLWELYDLLEPGRP